MQHIFGSFCCILIICNNKTQSLDIIYNDCSTENDFFYTIYMMDTDFRQKSFLLHIIELPFYSIYNVVFAYFLHFICISNLRKMENQKSATLHTVCSTIIHK